MIDISICTDHDQMQVESESVSVKYTNLSLLDIYEQESLLYVENFWILLIFKVFKIVEVGFVIYSYISNLNPRSTFICTTI